MEVGCEKEGVLLSTDSTARTVARSLAKAHHVELPRSDCGRATTRNACNLKMAFYKALNSKTRLNKITSDREIWRLWLTLHKHDCAGHIRKLGVAYPEVSLAHRLEFYGGRTLMMLAAWRGRPRALQTVMELAGDGVLNETDDNGFTPLCFAAWAGQARAVNWLISHTRINLDAAGFPPLTSSCGGRGPFKADVWAERKGHCDIAKAIRRRRSKLLADPS